MYSMFISILIGAGISQELELNSELEATAFNDRLFALEKLARPVREQDRLMFTAGQSRMYGFEDDDRRLAMAPRSEGMMFFFSKNKPSTDSGKKKGLFDMFTSSDEDDLDGGKHKKKKGGLFDMFQQNSVQAWEENQDVSDEGAGFNPIVMLINHLVVPVSAKRRALGLRKADAELPLDPQILNSIPINIRRAPLELAEEMQKYAAASSCSPQTLANWSCKENCEGHTAGTVFVKYIQDDQYQTAGYVAVNHNKRYVIVSYRGSSNLMNWLMDANALPVDYSLSEIKNSTSSKPFKVHSGFQKMAGPLLNKTRSTITPLLAEYPDYRLVLTGHSAGGAMATLVATALGGDGTVPWKSIVLITLGMPRVGDVIFCAYLNSHPLTSARITNPTDPVPLLPTQELGFHHPQHEYFLSDIKHLKESHTVTTCNSFGMSEDPSCARFDTTMKSMQGHFKYFGFFQTSC
ncbi:hypothetical protein DSO57_1020149 [Entomophthora muscae]|uniref:Uncharacterized protein n=1 Tax=Entomophthora muscae TaxID=34485 RepID=A0ACC2UPC9_9FUNG|nr:hypothetical protein DSO57_1020149 [Entomophthora muscae]